MSKEDAARDAKRRHTPNDLPNDLARVVHPLVRTACVRHTCAMRPSYLARVVHPFGGAAVEQQRAAELLERREPHL